jgi:hypothetical protein
MNNLVTGPTEQERAAGFTGAMPEELRNRIQVRLHDGLARIEIDYDTNTIGNFTTSNVTAFFYEAILPNMFQFETVTAVEVIDLSDQGCPGEVSCEPISRAQWRGGTWLPQCPDDVPPDALCQRP